MSAWGRSIREGRAADGHPGSNMVDDTVISDTQKEQENTTAVSTALAQEPTMPASASVSKVPGCPPVVPASVSEDAMVPEYTEGERAPPPAQARKTAISILRELNESCRQAERSVKSEKVLVLKPSVTYCRVVPELAGYNVKVKARGRTCTFMKSEVCKVPTGGGDLGIIEPPFEAIHEGDPSMYFQLCKTRLWGICPSQVMAVGILSLTEVFSSIGVNGEIGTWTVELLNPSERSIASLTVNIHCKKGTLSHHGGIPALKVTAMPQHRPRFFEATRADKIRGEQYCNKCVKAREALQSTLQAAEEIAADVTAVEAARRQSFMRGAINLESNNEVCDLDPAQPAEESDDPVESGEVSPGQRLRAAIQKGLESLSS